MRRLGLALLLLPLAAQAQLPIAPPSPTGPPPAAPATPDQPAAPLAPAPAWPNIWLPRHNARIAALDKLSAQPTDVTIPVGGSAQFRTLTIAVRSCLVRPPNQPADAAAWLDVTDSHPGSPEFHGWMLAGEPELAVLPSPLYDVRLLGCN